MSAVDTNPNTATADAAVVPSQTPNVAASLAAVEVGALITGRTLRFPIYDDTGVLLLAEGQVITGKFKELLRSRSIDEVRVDSSEVDNIALSADVLDLSQTAAFDTEVTKKLDSIIESGALFVANNGPAVKDSVVLHGCKAYDTEQREKVMEEHRQVSAELDEMMLDALHGKKLQGNKLLNTTAMYLSSMTADIDNVLTAAQEVGRDATLSQHCMQTTLLAMAIGIEMQLDGENVKTLGLCGLLHDWGMVKIPEAIRKAARVLTASEFLEIKKHPMHVLDFLERVSGIPSVVPLVCYQVHERPNGTGYPRERQKMAIHPFARILHVADQFVALTSDRPHRKPLTPYAATECLLRQAKTKAVDADVVRALLHVNSLFPIGSFVTLSDGSVARVLRRNGTAYATPIVQLVQNSDGTIMKENAPIVNLNGNDLRVIQALPTPGRGEITLTEDLLNVQR